MLRKTLLLAIALLSPLTFGAPDTTTVTGKVVTPSGLPARQGDVVCELSQPGSVDDGGVSARVASRVKVALGSDGAINLALVPNDTITPQGTTYACTFSVLADRRYQWVERWQLASSPDPIEIGDVTRLDAVPGLVIGPYLAYVDTEPDGSCDANAAPTVALDSNKLCVCGDGEALVWSCEALGGGGAGDMLKAVYDPDNDSVVNNAEVAERAFKADALKTASATYSAVAVDGAYVLIDPAQNDEYDVVLTEDNVRIPHLASCANGVSTDGDGDLACRVPVIEQETITPPNTGTGAGDVRLDASGSKAIRLRANPYGEADPFDYAGDLIWSTPDDGMSYSLVPGTASGTPAYIGTLSNRWRDVYSINGNFSTTVTANTFSGALNGNASTATALAADPSACPAGEYVDDVAANGTLSCSAPSVPTPTTMMAEVLFARHAYWSAGATGYTTQLHLGAASDQYGVYRYYPPDGYDATLRHVRCTLQTNTSTGTLTIKAVTGSGDTDGNAEFLSSASVPETDQWTCSTNCDLNGFLSIGYNSSNPFGASAAPRVTCWALVELELPF